MESYLSRYVLAAHADWSCLADIDESEEYEVDISEIWRKPDGTFVLVTASGCSCWDGEYETQDFTTLAEIEGSVLYRPDTYATHPSPRGAKNLVVIAHARLTVEEAGANEPAATTLMHMIHDMPDGLVKEYTSLELHGMVLSAQKDHRAN